MKQFGQVLVGLLMDIHDSLQRIESLLTKRDMRHAHCLACQDAIPDVVFPGGLCHNCYVKEKSQSGQ